MGSNMRRCIHLCELRKQQALRRPVGSVPPVAAAHEPQSKRTVHFIAKCEEHCLEAGMPVKHAAAAGWPAKNYRCQLHCAVHLSGLSKIRVQLRSATCTPGMRMHHDTRAVDAQLEAELAIGAALHRRYLPPRSRLVLSILCFHFRTGTEMKVVHLPYR